MPDGSKDAVGRLLISLRNQGVTLWLDNGELRCRAVKGALQPEQLITLRTFKTEIIDALDKGSAFAEAVPISIGSPGSVPINLTFQQQDWWKLSLQDSIFNLPDVAAWHLSGKLNCEAVCKSVEELIRRHESLRTRVTIVDDVPHQSFDAPGRFSLQLIDITNTPGADGIATARQLVQKMCQQVCNPCSDSLFAVRLIKLGDREHVLTWSLHHLIEDSTTFRVIFQEFLILYDAFARGLPSPLEAPPNQYSEYARWQLRTAQAVTAIHESYWQQRLAGAVGIRWPRVPSMRGTPGFISSVSIHFGDTVTRRVRAAAHRAKAALSMQMLTAYVIAVSRWCGQRDFVLATATTGRELPEHMHTTGYFAHMLYLRMQLNGDEQFADILAKVHEEFGLALSHHNFGRMFSRAPELGRVFFQWFTWVGDLASLVPPAVWESTGLSVKQLSYERDVRSPFDISIYLADGTEGIHGSIAYRADLFAARDIEDFAQSLCSVSELMETPSNSYG